ncbi:MAG: hypothetical protein DRJ52_04315 [Thermoprotei archaeon]|nr:MAG: hypothetical protein DRJ52_04315 [Thermoprotei archaeon]RLE99180.1 MAG: hypothetical protein DRJ63_06125 [Thermoprotei archaeon]HDI74631.1 hypothetical protein [Thermoprotei archaeon]
MFRLEEKYDLVLVAAVREDGTVEKLHFGSFKADVSKIIDSLLSYLRERGVTGGGKRRAGAIQFPILTLRLKDLKNLEEFIEQHLEC